MYTVNLFCKRQTRHANCRNIYIFMLNLLLLTVNVNRNVVREKCLSDADANHENTIKSYVCFVHHVIRIMA